jgi:hypothetical protein
MWPSRGLGLIVSGALDALARRGADVLGFDPLGPLRFPSQGVDQRA